MRIVTVLLAGLPWVAPLLAEVESGHARAGLRSGLSSYRPGRPLPVAIRMVVDPGWHSYWVNPGEGGMPLKAVWTLPAGWRVGDLKQPVPRRFMTGALPGFGYEGEVVFLTELLPPADAAGVADCKVKLSWLTCSDDACVPGKVELALTVPQGDGAAGVDAPEIDAAAAKIPVALEGLALELVEQGATLRFLLRGPTGFDPSDCDVFVATPQVVNPADRTSFVREGEVWIAEFRKNEYAADPVSLVDVVLAGGKLVRPVAVTWRREK